MSVLPLHPNVAVGRGHSLRSAGALLLDHAGIRAWQQLLFVQCGDGWIVEEAWRRARRGYACGVDMTAALVAQASALREVPGGIEFKLWDGARLPCPAAFFHGVFATLLLEWCRSPADALREIHRVLQPDGDVYLLEREPSLRGLPEGTASLIAMLQGAGFHDARELVRCEAAWSDSDSAAAVIIRARAAGLAA